VGDGVGEGVGDVELCEHASRTSRLVVTAATHAIALNATLRVPRVTQEDTIQTTHAAARFSSLFLPDRLSD
jgi:hypothetical protein